MSFSGNRLTLVIQAILQRLHSVMYEWSHAEMFEYFGHSKIRDTFCNFSDPQGFPFDILVITVFSEF